MRSIIELDWELLDNFISKEKKISSRRWFMFWIAASVSWLLWVKYSIEKTTSSIKSDFLKERAIQSRELFVNELMSLWLNQDIIENIVNSIVLIFTEDWLWTWFFVSPSFIMTAGHVLSKDNSDFSHPDKPSFIFDLNWDHYKPRRVFWNNNDDDLWWILVSWASKWYLDVFSQEPLKGKRISLWFWKQSGHVTTWNDVNWFRNINFQEVVKWKSDLNFITNGVIPWDSWGPVLDTDWNLVGLTVLKITPDYKIYDNKRYPWVPFHVDLKYWWVESLEDIREFIKNLK